MTDMSSTTLPLSPVSWLAPAAAAPPLDAYHEQTSASIPFVFVTFGLVLLSWIAAIAMATIVH